MREIERKIYKLINYDEMFQCLNGYVISPIYCTYDVNLQLLVLNDLIHNLHSLVPSVRNLPSANDIH